MINEYESQAGNGLVRASGDWRSHEWCKSGHRTRIESNKRWMKRKVRTSTWMTTWAALSDKDLPEMWDYTRRSRVSYHPLWNEGFVHSFHSVGGWARAKLQSYSEKGTIKTFVSLRNKPQVFHKSRRTSRINESYRQGSNLDARSQLSNSHCDDLLKT